MNGKMLQEEISMCFKLAIRHAHELYNRNATKKKTSISMGFEVSTMTYKASAWILNQSTINN
jgi:hypothetical protein